MSDVTLNMASFSGGKDSTALYLYLLDREVDFTPVFADTGHEHPETYAFVQKVSEEVPGPEIRWVRYDFTEKITRKQEYIANHWADKGVPQERIDRALEVLQPTGVPFLDLCLWKGRFPSSQARFCTEWLKTTPIFEQMVFPALEAGQTVVSWQGIRADESPNRANAAPMENLGGGQWIRRPLLGWTYEDVFAIHERFGVEPNPLYKQGMSRVGCMPCIMANKNELSEIGKRYPDEVERVAEWERLVSEASKRGISSFFPHDTIPHKDHHKAVQQPGIKEVIDWSRTSRGGRQWTLDFEEEDEHGCTSQYGLCE